jgi:hypothetical protein
MFHPHVSYIRFPMDGALDGARSHNPNCTTISNIVVFGSIWVASTLIIYLGFVLLCTICDNEMMKKKF